MQYGYIRLEKPDQEALEARKKELEEFTPDRFFVDENASGEAIAPELASLLEILEPRDTIITHACTTLSTDEAELQKIINRIRKKKASVRFLDLSNHGMENPVLRALKAKQTQRWL